MSETVIDAVPVVERRGARVSWWVSDRVRGVSGEDVVAEWGERLLRGVLDAGLRLDSLHAVFERPCASGEKLRAASVAVESVLDDLDAVLREAGPTVLAYAHAHLPPRGDR